MTSKEVLKSYIHMQYMCEALIFWYQSRLLRKVNSSIQSSQLETSHGHLAITKARGVSDLVVV
jgi:hypothetical protein